MTDDRGTFEHAELDRAAPRARLLHRRHGPRPRRRDPRARRSRVAVEGPRRQGPAVPQRRAGPRRRLPQPDGPRRALDRTSRPSTTAGAGASGGSAPPPPTADVSLVRQAGRRAVRARGQARSPWPRAMAFAALGAAELLTVEPGTPRRASSSPTAADRRPSPRPTSAGRGPSRGSPTPTRSSPEAMIAAGVALDDPAPATARPRPAGAGCSTTRRVDGHLSVDPRRRQRTGRRPARASTSSPSRWPPLADACARAAASTGEPRGRGRRRRRRRGSSGDNDAGLRHVGPGDRRRLRRPPRRRGRTATRAPSRRWR